MTYSIDLLNDTFFIKILSDATWLETWLPSIIEIFSVIATLIGIYIAFRSLRTTMKYNIEQQKAERLMQKTETLPELILNLLSHMQGGDSAQLTEQLTKIYNIVYGYGSVDAIKITVAMQKSFVGSTQPEGEPTELKKMEPLCYMTLLISQIKYDVTGEIIHPISWFDLKINDLEEETRNGLVTIINNIVIYLGLNRNLVK